MNYRIVMVLMSTLVVLPTLTHATGVDLLIKMNNALHQMNYSGTLVHIKGNKVNTLRVEHEVIAGVENERITNVNDPKGSVLSQSKSFSRVMVPSSIDKMKKVYSLDVGVMKKVAQRDCQIVVARPKDKMRYLQRYCIDKETNLPLSYSLIDNKHNAVERFTFTELNVSPDGSSDVSEAVTADTSPSQGASANNSPSGKWSVKTLPKGFYIGKAAALDESYVKKAPDTEYFVLTDGLSSISVFISPVSSAKQKSVNTMNSGALNVLTSQKNNHRITLVGEVPRETMERIFSSLEYQGKP